MYLVVGKREQINSTVNVVNQVHGKYPLDDLIGRLHCLNKSRVLNSQRGNEILPANYYTYTVWS